VAIDPGMPTHRVEAHLRPVPTPEQSRHTIRAMDDALPRLPREGPSKRCLKDERTPINSEDKGEAYLSSEGCLVIFGGSTASECNRMWEFTTREVNMAGSSREAAQAFFICSEVVFTFDEVDRPNHAPQPGCFYPIVSPIVGQTRLTKVLMDGGSGLNLLYAKMYDIMGLPRAVLRPSMAHSTESYRGSGRTLGTGRLAHNIRQPQKLSYGDTHF
jgi:hypothetical protein